MIITMPYISKDLMSCINAECAFSDRNLITWIQKWNVLIRKFKIPPVDAAETASANEYES